MGGAARYTDGRCELWIDRTDGRESNRNRFLTSELPMYGVQAVVPDWYPLVPEEVRTALIPFRLAELAGPGLDSRPKGRLIVSRLSVHEEEVPRDGVSDAPPGAGPLVRWVSHSWVRREKSPGSGESSSGLAFDTVRPTERWPG